ncbi:hypothetical protein PG999_010253 [Apiospora kogelbergensis]|uniref:DUF7918 domain-containing protein n=1 Tax=Apiospora kogelbergensis TaxID=1337665 RepID=A0AAW0QC86_9PEZI
MAVLDDVPGIQVFVKVKGGIATEFSDSGQQQPTENGCPVVCSYIESFDNRHFAIVTDVNRFHDFSLQNHTLSFRVYVDGGYMVNNCITEDYVRYDYGRRTVSGPLMLDERGQNTVQQKFKFAAVMRVEDDRRDRVLRDKDRAKNLGVIEVQVFRIILGEATKFGRRAPMRKENLELSEKALKGKAISHGASYGKQGAASELNQSFDADDIPEDGGPIAVYRFLYRSKEALKQELIIPRSPSPPDLLDDRGVDVPGRDQDRRQELVELRAKCELQLLNIKRELGEVFDPARDSRDRLAKRSRTQEKRVEVIDLTEE